MIKTVYPNKDFNPFFYNGIEIPEKYFCDRECETEKITDLVRNGNNIVMKAPRRLGKSSLIHHVFKQQTIAENYNTIYVDIYSTRSSDDFVALLYRAVSECETISGKSELRKIEKSLKEISYDTEINIPRILKVSKTSKYEILKIEKSLDTIFDFLSKTKRPNLVVIDEFQQIKLYEDCDIEASLRSFIQKTPNTNFIFSGSSRHMLTQMFDSPDKPFYRSCRSVTLDIIPKETYLDFCSKQFESNNKQIENETVELVYDIFSGNTFMMQQTMNGIYQFVNNGETAALQDAKRIIEAIVDEKAEDYRTYLHGLKPSYEKVLLCIAREGIASDLLSETKRKEYGLPASTSVSNILRYFSKDESRTIEKLVPGTYRIEDKFLELWAAKYVFGNLESKFSNAAELFAKETELKSRIVF